MPVVEQIPERLTIITLQESEYLHTIRELADRRFAGGRICDALLLACARKSGAATIYSWNAKHLRQLAPDLTEECFWKSGRDILNEA